MTDLVAVFAFGVLVGLTTGISISSNFQDQTLLKEATARGYGQYCPLNGEWHWKNECEVEQ